MEDTYDIHDDLYCPKCKHSPLHSRSCTNLFCEDGYIEDFADDLENIKHVIVVNLDVLKEGKYR